MEQHHGGWGGGQQHAAAPGKLAAQGLGQVCGQFKSFAALQVGPGGSRGQDSLPQRCYQHQHHSQKAGQDGGSLQRGINAGGRQLVQND